MAEKIKANDWTKEQKAKGNKAANDFLSGKIKSIQR